MTNGPAVRGAAVERNRTEQVSTANGTGSLGRRPAALLPSADRSQVLDAAVLRWVAEHPDDYAARVLDRLTLDESTGCQRWAGPVKTDGYAAVRLPPALGVPDAEGKGAWVRVPRAVLVASLGRPLVYGWTTSHDCADEAHAAGACGHCTEGGDSSRCPFRRCASPRHLREVTTADNTRSGRAAVPKGNGEQCRRGHRLTPGNLVAANEERGWWTCLRCHREGGALRRAAGSRSRAAAEARLGPARVAEVLAEVAERWGYARAGGGDR